MRSVLMTGIQISTWQLAFADKTRLVGEWCTTDKYPLATCKLEKDLAFAFAFALLADNLMMCMLGREFGGCARAGQNLS
ncbi:hypothetical protein N7456_002280 [Penicillium angulare]|uniref:Uncharacterized protein n=1 Tax=Penicillium angulare TaxID=116970 RepID=A0A9W9KQ40_9EURO|nr:hypothetical protein N7456_002280 [Penicillium angulare]